MNLNKKEIIQISATGFLVLVLILLVLNASRSGKSKRAVSKKDIPAASLPIGQTAGKLSGFFKLAEEGKKLEFSRDPFSKKMTERIASPSRSLILSGIVWDPKNPTAIINDRIVAVGGEIEGNTVLDIKENHVVLTDGTQNFELKLY